MRHGSVRVRLTLLFGGLFLAAGAALLAITYGLVSHATNGIIVARAGGMPVGPGAPTALSGTQQLQAVKLANTTRAAEIRRAAAVIRRSGWSARPAANQPSAIEVTAMMPSAMPEYSRRALFSAAWVSLTYCVP